MNKSSSTSKKLRINHQIRIPKVHLIDEEGNDLGETETSKALKLADLKGLDLVEVNPLANPSIAKLMDYGKYLYKKAKAEKRQSSRKVNELKGVRFAYRTDDNDLKFKAKRVDKFLQKGHKVKIDMLVRGREKSHGDLIRDKLNNFLNLISEEYILEKNPKKGPRGLSLIIRKK